MRSHLYLILFIFIFLNLAHPKDSLRALSESVVTAIQERDSISLISIAADTFCEYSTIDIDASHVTGKMPKDYYKLMDDGYINYEKKYFMSNKVSSLKIFFTECIIFKREKYPLIFNQLKQINKNRAEILLNGICDVGNVHLVFIRKRKWEFVGWFFENARVDS